MTTQDGQDEVGAILVQIAMIAEEVNVLALEGSSARRTRTEQLACLAEVQRMVGGNVGALRLGGALIGKTDWRLDSDPRGRRVGGRVRLRLRWGFRFP